jgi:hypothetical protein
MLILDLHQRSRRHQPVQFLAIPSQRLGRRILQQRQVRLRYVRLRTLGEAKGEYRAVTLSEQDQRAIAARLALSRPRYPLLDNAAAEIGIDQPAFRALYRLP